MNSPRRMKLDTESMKGKTLSLALEQGIDIKIALLHHYQQLGCLLAEEIMAEEVKSLAGDLYSRDNEEFYIDKVFYNPQYNSLVYIGKHLSQISKKFDNTTITEPIKNIIEIPGEIKIGYYKYSTGEIVEHIEE